MSGSTRSRHTACIECRQRKVRCDGGQPYCQNCLRRGSTCVFTRNSDLEKEELLSKINELADRLSQAERTFATQSADVQPTSLSNEDMSQDIMQSDIEMDFTGFWSLTNDGDNGALIETNIPIFQDEADPGTMPNMPNVQPNVVALSQLTELDCPSQPIMKTPQVVSGTESCVTPELGEEGLSSHSLTEL
ncbi:MAG: hypothetical protein Q9165_001961 [Trypethelium subeluteriae]